jgi:hypothetical protein
MGESDASIAIKSGVQLAADVRNGLISAAELLEVFVRRTRLTRASRWHNSHSLHVVAVCALDFRCR